MIKVEILLLHDANNGELLTYIKRHINRINEYFIVTFILLTKSQIRSKENKEWLRKNRIDGFPTLIHIADNGLAFPIKAVPNIINVLSKQSKQYIEFIQKTLESYNGKENTTTTESAFYDKDEFKDDALVNNYFEKLYMASKDDTDESRNNDNDYDADVDRKLREFATKGELKKTEIKDPEYLRAKEKHKKYMDEKRASLMRPGSVRPIMKSYNNRVGHGREPSKSGDIPMPKHELRDTESPMGEDDSVRRASGADSSAIMGQVMDDQETKIKKSRVLDGDDAIQSLLDQFKR